MLSKRIVRALFICISLMSCSRSQQSQIITYTSPPNGAQWVRPKTNIIVRFTKPIGSESLASVPFIVRGSSSRDHQGRFILADDQRTVIFRPDTPFLTDEFVSVSLSTAFSRQLPTPDGFSFGFTTGISNVQSNPLEILQVELTETKPENVQIPNALTQVVGDTLPIDFPYLNAQLLDNPSPGRIFMSNFSNNSPASSYLIIAENSGQPFFFRKNIQTGFDFKLQKNGLLTYYELSAKCFYALDNFYQVVDSFRCGNGYTADLHDLQILPNGHALILAYDPETIDMSSIVPGGNPQAKVTGLILQELDQDKNIVFEWRSWDHFKITDATHENLTASTIDYVHGNAVELDTDGNILLSSRHMDEVTKINRETGEIIWRLGGKNNQFTFVNDSIGFSHQHDIRRLPNGDITRSTTATTTALHSRELLSINWTRCKRPPSSFGSTGIHRMFTALRWGMSNG